MRYLAWLVLGWVNIFGQATTLLEEEEKEEKEKELNHIIDANIISCTHKYTVTCFIYLKTKFISNKPIIQLRDNCVSFREEVIYAFTTYKNVGVIDKQQSGLA